MIALGRNSREAPVRSSLAIALAAWFFTLAHAEADETLRWKLAPGQRLHYSRTHQRVNEMVEGTVRTKETLVRVTDMALTVARLDSDGTAALVLTIDRIRYQRNSPAGAMSYDSADAAATKDDGKLAPTLRELLDSAFSFKMNGLGEITDIHVSGRSAKVDPAVDAQAPAGHVLPASNALAVRHLMPSVLLPRDPVALGTRWRQRVEFTEPLLGLRRCDVTYKYAGQEVRDATRLEKIRCDSELHFLTAKQEKLKPDIRDSDNRGTIYFDNVAGRLVEKQETERLKIVIRSGERTIEQDIRSDVSVRFSGN
ncbi:MAG TPA: hypothetical protein VGZ47_04100 [Gemmataceae bacterium]|jgi:hypothetical protein|nr:hypothetical protein [Gemmataceae bacterium]